MTNKHNLERLTHVNSLPNLDIICKAENPYKYTLVLTNYHFKTLVSLTREDLVLWAAKHDDIRVFEENFKIEDLEVISDKTSNFNVDVDMTKYDSRLVFEAFYRALNKLKQNACKCICRTDMIKHMRIVDVITRNIVETAVSSENYYFVLRLMRTRQTKNKMRYSAVRTEKMAEYLFLNEVTVPKNLSLSKIIDEQNVDLLLWFIKKGVNMGDEEMCMLLSQTDNHRYNKVFERLTKRSNKS